METSYNQKHFTRSIRHAADFILEACLSPSLKRFLGVCYRVFIAAVLLLPSGCVMNDKSHVPKPSWLQRAFVPRPSRLADPEDRLSFEPVVSYRRSMGESVLIEKIKELREGDLVAASLGKFESGRDLIMNRRLNYIAYTVLDYGHLDIVINDPEGSGDKVLFTCQSFEGVNAKRRLKDLVSRDWDAFRISNWDRVNRERLYDFIKIGIERGQNAETYDNFSALGFRNANLKPVNKDDIGGGYICSTVVVAALYYSGVELDNMRSSSYNDLVSPKQVITSKGRFFQPAVNQSEFEK
ncbi:MAG: hypothetical protein VX961_03580 [Verrucomicrobiota bacterium]|nr:hypothetical protein [Verrucomicrobiota bacterium]